MHLSATQTHALSDVMRLVAQATDADALRASLALPMLELLGADQYVSMVWNATSDRFERYTALNVSADSFRAWDAHYRFVDPLTFPMMGRRRPCLATQILGQQALAQTEFFNDFLRPERMHWGVNVYFFDQQSCVGDMRIWRRAERGNFDSQALAVLRMVEPCIAAALGRLRPPQEGLAAIQALESAELLLQRNARLSRREGEVAWLATSGQSDKQIAQQLQMSHGTVRFHLANAFRKLRADNRTALASRVRSIIEARRLELDRMPTGRPP